MNPQLLYTPAVSRYLHSLSAALFYVVAGSFFLAYVLLRNGIGGAIPGVWLEIGDLPLLALGLLYGGVSVYRSLTGEHPSPPLAAGLTLSLFVIFLIAAVANFWPALSGI